MSAKPVVVHACGEAMVTIDCPDCDGAGFVDHDCGEDTCVCRNPEPNVACDGCDGTGMVSVCQACYFDGGDDERD